MRGRPAQQNHPWVRKEHVALQILVENGRGTMSRSLQPALTLPVIFTLLYLFVCCIITFLKKNNSQPLKTAHPSFSVQLQDQALKKRRKREKKRKMSPVARVKGKKRKGRKNLFQAPEDLNTVQVKRLHLCPSTLSQHDEVPLLQRTLVRTSSRTTALKRKEKMEITYLQVSEQHTISHLKTG